MQFFFAEIHPFLAVLLISIDPDDFALAGTRTRRAVARRGNPVHRETSSAQRHAPRGYIFVFLGDFFFAFIFFLFGLKKKGMPV